MVKSAAKPAHGPRASAAPEALEDTLAVVAAATELYRMGGAMDAVLAAGHDLDIRLYTVLRLVNQGLCFPSQIAEAMGLPRSVVTRMLHVLSQKGRLVRALDSVDARRTRLALTAEGEAVFQAATASLSGWMAPRLRRIGDAGLEGFLLAIAVFAE